jgi:hypothetical protein
VAQVETSLRFVARAQARHATAAAAVVELALQVVRRLVAQAVQVVAVRANETMLAALLAPTTQVAVAVAVEYILVIAQGIRAAQASC